MSLRRRRTRTVATLGPASASPQVMARLFRTGVDVFRLNFGVRAACSRGIPVVVATQMLESMITAPAPPGPRLPTSWQRVRG